MKLPNVAVKIAIKVRKEFICLYISDSVHTIILFVSYFISLFRNDFSAGAVTMEFFEEIPQD
jgi:hypothetical protein